MADALPYPKLRTTLISYVVTGVHGAELRVGGRFQLPLGSGSRPAVVIVHGSAGVDSRGQTHALDLNRAGIATLEIDLWGARGLTGGAAQRPQQVWETLPDAFGALAFLAGQDGVEARRVGLLGFSWGGCVTLLAATRRYAEQHQPGGLRFAAHAALYPVCWLYNRVPGYEFRDLTGAPLLLVTGGRDRYDADVQAGPKLRASLPEEDQRLVTCRVFEDAEHGFNMLEEAFTYHDPFLYGGRGGEGLSAPHPAAREQVRPELVEFFTRM